MSNTEKEWVQWTRVAFIKSFSGTFSGRSHNICLLCLIGRPWYRNVDDATHTLVDWVCASWVLVPAHHYGEWVGLMCWEISGNEGIEAKEISFTGRWVVQLRCCFSDERLPDCIPQVAAKHWVESAPASESEIMGFEVCFTTIWYKELLSNCFFSVIFRCIDAYDMAGIFA